MSKKQKFTDKVKNGAKLVAITAAGIVGAETFAVGAKCAVNDAKIATKLVKETVNPSVYKVKQGRFGKAMLVTQNPWTGKVKQYAGKKAAVNSKVIKLSKAVKVVK